MAKKRKKTEEDIKIENELLKLKMMAEFGGDFHAENEMPPEVENVFLKHIQKFQQQQVVAKSVSIWEFIGKPTIVPSHQLSDEELHLALAYLYKLLKKQNIIVETLFEEDERVFYRYIVDTILPTMVQDIKMGNIVMHFVYHDDKENNFDFKTEARAIIENIFVKFDEDYSFFLQSQLHPEADSQLPEKIIAFQQSLEDIKIDSIRLIDVDVLDILDKGNIHLKVDYRTKAKPKARFKKESVFIELELHKTEEEMWKLMFITTDSPIF